MKNINIFRICGIAVASAMTLSACSDILDEQPRSSYTPGFFATEAGVKGGLTSLYAGLRNIYGQAYIYSSMEAGTDEYTWAQSGNSDGFKSSDMTTPMTPSNSSASGIWDTSFSELNTAFSVIENASAVGIDEALVAEARFFVGFHYFNLVQTFGGVPLDMGGGELHSNTSPKRTSVRNKVPEVYGAIFKYLEEAVDKLPDTPRQPGTVTKTTARLVLAKAYLTYAWWLENPNNIDTFPTCDRDKSQAKSYFEKAYATAYAGYTDTKTANALEPYFYLANIAQNDRNCEWLLWADHTQESEQYNGGSLGYGGGGAPDNFAGWFATWNYCGGWLNGKDQNGNTINPVQREASQPLGRPWTRIAAVVEGLSKFTDTKYDSRWDGTFTSEYRVNIQKVDKSFQYVTGANGSKIEAYGTYLKFLPADYPNIASIKYNAENANCQAGELAGEPAWVIDVNWVSRSRYPGIWKLGPCRTDYDFDNALGSPNAGSTRPYVILKFSELYLVAAEAAVKLGDNKKAVEALTPLRQRAGRWNYIVNEGNPKTLSGMKGDDLRNLPVIHNYADKMVELMPATITIDYILDERLREFWGEGYRWYDLVRTQKWAEVAGKYTICGDFSLNKETVTRSISNYHYLRPIPQGQIDALEMTDEEKKAYQNPGY